MKRAVICSSPHKAQRPVHWAILLLPIFFCGCFDSQNAKTLAARGKGIAALSRFFFYSQTAPAQAAAEPVSDFGSRPFLPQGITAPPDLAQDAAELEIALPGFLGDHLNANAGLPYKDIAKAPGAMGRNRASGAGTAAGLSILNSSFSQLFSSVFNQGGNGESALAAKEDLPNPFTEERLKRETSPAKAAEPSDTAAKSESKAPESSEEKTTSTPPASAGAGIRWDKEFLILGDFDGAGRLSARSAQRSGEAIFLSDDGERGFNLYVNYAALDQQAAFYVDDMNGDGITDLLITNRFSLFGGVLLGDGNGGYRIADRFMTGYEPVIASAGPFRGAMREILTVNTRNGALTRFVPEDRYRPAQKEFLSLLPDFLLHLVAPDTSRDFLLAGQMGGSEQILGWSDNDLLQPAASSLGADPTALAGSFGVNSLQVYQVGSYASIVLSSQGKVFNVANLRVTPQTYLVLGDVYQQGFVDVGVGTLSHFLPRK